MHGSLASVGTSAQNWASFWETCLFEENPSVNIDDPVDGTVGRVLFWVVGVTKVVEVIVIDLFFAGQRPPADKDKPHTSENAHPVEKGKIEFVELGKGMVQIKGKLGVDGFYFAF